jgi:type VI protein secretion system component Hcp
MATDAFGVVVQKKGCLLPSVSRLDLSGGLEGANYPLKQGRPSPMIQPGFVFEGVDYSFDVAQSIATAPTGSGAGAGKVTFNPLSLTMLLDTSTATLFQDLAAGTNFRFLDIVLRKSGTAGGGGIYAIYGFGNLFATAMSFSHDDESPKQTTTFQYLQASIAYRMQNSDGTFGSFVVKGWDRSTNRAI